MELNFICDFESVYNLYQHRSEIEKIPGFGKSSVQKLIDAIEVSKKCKFASVIVAIGIPGIGKSSAKALAKYCIAMGGSNALQTLIDCAESNYDWTQLEDFGAVTSNGINEYVRKNKMEIAALIPILEIEDDGEQSNIDNKFGGNEEKQGWAEQAKMRANKTASSYNNYILKNNYVWKDGVPNDIYMELSYIE